jgi:hypothetical protein
MSITHSTEIINGEAITILIETADSLDSTTQSTDRTRATTRGVTEDTLRRAQNVFSDGVALVRHCATQVVTGVQSLDDSLKPDSLEVQLAIKLTTEMGAVLAKVSGEAQMQVKLTWKLKNTPTS